MVHMAFDFSNKQLRIGFACGIVRLKSKFCFPVIFFGHIMFYRDWRDSTDDFVRKTSAKYTYLIPHCLLSGTV